MIGWVLGSARCNWNHAPGYGVMTDMSIPKLHGRGICAILVGLLCGSCLGQNEHPPEGRKALILPPSATDVKRSDETCQELDYVVASTYPGDDILNLISDELGRQGWLPVDRVERRFMRNPGVFRTAARWEHFKSIAGTTTYTRAQQWSNAAGDVVSYNLWYEKDDLKRLSVFGRFCDHGYVAEHRCIPGPPKPHDEKKYAVSMKIGRIEPEGRDFKVFVSIQNMGSEPVLLGLNGKLSDGSPELWVLEVEQEEHGEWGYVGSVCAEHPAFDWITLRPGQRVESWAMAVEFPEPDHWWAKCQRKVAHLHGRIRASIYYYTGVCEIENPLETKGAYFAASEPIALPSKPD